MHIKSLRFYRACRDKQWKRVSLRLFPFSSRRRQPSLIALVPRGIYITRSERFAFIRRVWALAVISPLRKRRAPRRGRSPHAFTAKGPETHTSCLSVVSVISDPPMSICFSAATVPGGLRGEPCHTHPTYSFPVTAQRFVSLEF